MSASHAVDTLKADAKEALRLARAGDVTVIRALRQLLPRLSSNTDAEFAANVKLADVQHALATQRGAKSWAELRRSAEAVHPLQIQVERFLLAVREANRSKVQELLSAHPAIATYNIHAAAAACDAGAVAAFLNDDALLATAQAPPDRAEPVIYACGTPLHNISDEMSAANARCVELLLNAGGNPNAFVMYGEKGDEAPISAMYFACAGNNVSATRLLLERGANPNDGESVYHAAERNHRACLELLLAHGANLSDAHAHWGNTPLYFLANYKPQNPMCASSELGMQWLLEHGANPNVASNPRETDSSSPPRAETPLHRIASHGKSVDVARMLVEHGAVVDTPRGDGKTAYALAVRAGNTPVAEYLASAGANTSATTSADEFIAAALAADETRARAMLAQQPSLMSTLSNEDSQALLAAVEENRESSVRVMASLGWDLTVESPWGGTALHWAAWHGRVAMTTLLVGVGAPVNIRDSTYGSSPIAWAAHGSTNSHVGHDDDYCAIVDILAAAGSTREAAYNKWTESPERMASKAVKRRLRALGFVP